MRRFLFLFFLFTIAASAQAPIPTASASNPDAPESPYVLHVTTREVLVDVVAVNSRNQPITDLKPADLQVIEDDGQSRGLSGRIPHDGARPVSISSLRLIDPTAANPGSPPGAGFRIAASESCLQRHTVHYELAYHPGPQGLTSGSHQVLIRASRRGVRLFYRHGYYIGATVPSAGARQKSPAEIDHELQIDACSHPLVPLSISLQAYRISTGSEEPVRYSVSIEPGSLNFVSDPENGRQLQLDYGACHFNAAGKPIGYMKASTDQVLTPEEFVLAQEHGINRLFDFTPPNDVAMTRFVVRDRATGNLGLVDVTFLLTEGSPQRGVAVPERLKEEARWYEHELILAGGRKAKGSNPSTPPVYYPTPPQGPLGSFGSVVPRTNAFCGDVYELQADIQRLPDFRDFDPIGSIYIDSLAVPDQIFEGTNGIPGVTDRTVWFGVDYYANFFVRNPGTYEFRLTSDDGAVLLIDDEQVIDLDKLHPAFSLEGRLKLDVGSHTIHVPYYEGTPYAVALSLWVRSPGEQDWKIFDLRDFANPDEHSIRTQP